MCFRPQETIVFLLLGIIHDQVRVIAHIGLWRLIFVAPEPRILTVRRHIVQHAITRIVEHLAQRHSAALVAVCPQAIIKLMGFLLVT